MLLQTVPQACCRSRVSRRRVSIVLCVLCSCRYKPEIAAAVAALPKATSDGLPVEMAVDSLKVAVLPVDTSALSSSSPRVPLGPVAARAELLRARGYAPAIVPAPEFTALPDATAKAKCVLYCYKC